tara:strand:- start:1376 stop:3142 length:1767 start_codon:yes stop_codon:yes gene_type:complete
MHYVEIAKGSPRNRGLLIVKTELGSHINTNEPLYRSMYLYDNDAIEYSNKKGSIANYFGTRYIDKILIDIDKKDNSDVQTLNRVRALIYEIGEQGLGDEHFQAFFSGSGYHILLSNSVFNFEPSKDLPVTVKYTMQDLFPDIDCSIYSRSGIYRLQHTINQKTNLFKIPLTSDEVHRLKPEEIMELAKEPRLEYPYHELVGDGELEEFINKNPERIVSFKSVTEPSKVVPCVQSLLREGPTEGSRHNKALRIASHLKRNGIPSSYAKVVLNHWNNNSLDEQHITTLTESAYNGNYRYSCNDEYLKARCQTRCIHFKHKDYLIDVMNAKDMQQDLDDRLTADFSGRSYDLSKMFGLEEDKECIIFPGELVTIFGPTGSNKTTLAQNIVLGHDFAHNKIVKDWQIPTLFLSLELSAWYMHRRHLQIVSGLTKKEVNANYKEVYNEHKHLLGHLGVQTVVPSINQIKEKIKELQPSVVIIDYIDLVETPREYRGEYEKVKFISHNLSNLAVNMDIIIIQISQVSREYSKNEVLDLYSGKGSGAIENASRKVIGINGQANTDKKRIEMFKNTDGELFECDVEWTPSFRLRRV